MAQHAAGQGQGNPLRRQSQLSGHGGGHGGQFAGGVINNQVRDGIGGLGLGERHLGQGGNGGAVGGKLPVSVRDELLRGGEAQAGQQAGEQLRARAAAVGGAGGGPQRGQAQGVAAPLVPQQIPPAAGASRLTVEVLAEAERSGAGNQRDPP